MYEPETGHLKALKKIQSADRDKLAQRVIDTGFNTEF